jgi:hypothetical protein
MKPQNDVRKNREKEEIRGDSNLGNRHQDGNPEEHHIEEREEVIAENLPIRLGDFLRGLIDEALVLASQRLVRGLSPRQNPLR